MKVIIEEDCREETLRTIVVGHYFITNGQLWLKILQMEGFRNAFNMSTGEFVQFDQYHHVEAVHSDNITITARRGGRR